MSKDKRHYCHECRSLGFEPSILPDRCTLCDGTYEGHPPTEQELAEVLLPDGYTMVPTGTPRAENYIHWFKGGWWKGWPGGVGLKSSTWKIANPVPEIKLEDIVTIEISKKPITNGPIQAQNCHVEDIGYYRQDPEEEDERVVAEKNLPEGYALEPKGKGTRRKGYLYWSMASQMWEPGTVLVGVPIPPEMIIANKVPPNYPPEDMVIPPQKRSYTVAQVRELTDLNRKLSERSEENVAGPGDDPELPPGYVRVPTGGKKSFRWLFKQDGWWRYGSPLEVGGLVQEDEVVAKPQVGFMGVYGPLGGKAFKVEDLVKAVQPKSVEPRYWVVNKDTNHMPKGTLVQMHDQKVFRRVYRGDELHLVEEEYLSPVELDERRAGLFEDALRAIEQTALPESARQVLYSALCALVVSAK